MFVDIGTAIFDVLHNFKHDIKRATVSELRRSDRSFGIKFPSFYNIMRSITGFL